MKVDGRKKRAHNFVDRTGQEIGWLTVVGLAPKRGKKTYWTCRCRRCGNIKEVSVAALISGRQKSCGCLMRENNRTNRLTHGKRRTPEYEIWAAIKQRCSNPNNRAYKDYGARGIKMCERWLNDFTAFIADLGERPGKEYTVERRNNDGNYCPENCYWATDESQKNNRRDSVRITWRGETKTLTQWARLTGIDPKIVRSRIRNYGWSVDEALTTPANRRDRPLTEEEKWLRERARAAVRYRVKCGDMPPVRSLECVQCGKPAKHYHHHHGYDKSHQLDVIPLCLSCHGRD